MKAAIFQQFGGPEVIEIADIDAPVLRANEVLVQVQAVSVNHVDTFVRSGGFKTALANPHVIGRDLVGVIRAVGQGVSGFQIGDLVWSNSMGYDGRSGATSELVAVPAERLYHVPEGVDAIQLVATVHSAATAAIVLTSVMHAKIGQTILVEGAAGHVGTKLVQIAAQMGLTVMTTSNQSDFKHLSALGSRQCIDYHQSVTDLMNVDHIIDTSGKVSLQDNLNLLNQDGEVTLITAPTDNRSTFDVRAFYTSQKHINGFVISHATLAQLTAAAKIINHLVIKGTLLDDDYRILPVDQAAQAHADLEQGVLSHQRIILKF